MLDVHPTHHAASTWKDFFIHIATICVGLLIAVGLEQTVEAVHHAGERRELVRDIHSECAANLKVLDHDIGNARAFRAWDMASIAAVENAKAIAGVVTVTLPALAPDSEFTVATSRSAWTVAKTNGKAALLPENLAEIFDRLDLEGSIFQKTGDDRRTVNSERHILGNRLRTDFAPGSTMHFAMEERKDLTNVLAREEEANRTWALWAGVQSGACRAVLDGIQRRDDMTDYLIRYQNEAIKP